MIKLEETLEQYQRGYAEIDLDAILANMWNMRQNIAPETEMIAVIKTDGYGHGSVPIARTLEPLDFLWGFAAATYEEAHELREAGIRKPILILGHAFPYCYGHLAEEGLRPAVFRMDTIPLLEQAAEQAGKPIRVHIKADTGMNRIGITPDEEGLRFVETLSNADGIIVEGIFTHFARADEHDKASALRQLESFQDFIRMIKEKLGLTIPFKHCSNSAGILELPQADMDAVRAGIALYGLYPSKEVGRDTVPLRPAMSLYSHLVWVKTIHQGQSVSYGGTFTAGEDMRVATVPIGYGDGYPRSLSNRGYVLIRGKRAPVLGRVCMDQFMVDVTRIPEAKEGDRVVLLGTDGGERIGAEQLGEMSGRFHYELVCDIGRRIPRIYRKEGELFRWI
ncbi:MAG: alanine racemase [Eubacterium sp.]|nr:alanine racemase [Eubacterium sp.]MCM1305140.1 alanine racemase [Butyrivibrio sp.]MCM1344381.1 alanine racemase [Muribaculaceae bacterium]MCM1411733.1 alanine racemase [Lachnospiraceae bacterium]